MVSFIADQGILCNQETISTEHSQEVLSSRSAEPRYEVLASQSAGPSHEVLASQSTGSSHEVLASQSAGSSHEVLSSQNTCFNHDISTLRPNTSFSQQTPIANDKSNSTFHKDSLRVMQANVDTLTNKMEEFQTRVVLEQPDIILLQEVLPKNSLDDIQPDIEFKIDGYNIFCAENMRRGTITYVSQKIPATTISSQNITDVCTCSITLPGQRKLQVCNVYRSPSSDSCQDDELYSFLAKLTANPVDSTVIGGDFNLRNADWTKLRGSCPLSRKLIDFTLDNFLHQHVEEATRYREGQQDSLLDIVLTDYADMISNIIYSAPLGKSDHVCITYDITREANIHANDRERRNFYKGNYTQIKEDISSVNWSSEFQGKDINEAWDLFERVLSASVDTNIPISKSNSRHRKKWMTREVEAAIKDKHKTYNKYRKDRSEVNREKYKTAKNKATQAAKEARSKFESRIASNVKDNPKEFWGYVKHQTGRSDSISPLTKEDGSLAVEADDKAEVLNQFFASVFTEEDVTSIPTPAPHQLSSTLTDITFSEDRIIQMIKSMKSGSSAGPDGIHPRVLKETSHVIAPPLCLIFNMSMAAGQVPKAWKDATVVPIFKKGSRSSPSNYRPVSLTSVCCKLMEKVVRSELIAHADRNKLFAAEQHGFRSGRSCTTQLLTVVEKWTHWYDDHGPFDCIYLDYRKAFDAVPHARLLAKLEAFGVSGNVHKWIKSFLSLRRQRVRVEGSLSRWEKVTSGIPQGSCLGPTLFLVFINDLPMTISSLSALFADDSKVFRLVNTDSDIEELQNDLHSLHQWSAKWQLPFNSSKCKVIHYGAKNPKASYTLGELKLSEVDRETDLGVLFDTTLSFSSHHDKQTAKANARLGLIKRSFSNIQPIAFVQLYKSLVRPVVEYCSTVTNPVYKKDSDKIESVQRRATRLVQGMDGKSYEERLQALNLQSLCDRRSRADLVQAYRIIHKVDDLEEDIFFQRAPCEATRTNGSKLFKQHCRTKLRSCTFSQRVVDDWNELPQSVVNAPGLNYFKSGLRKFKKCQTDAQAKSPIQSQALRLLVEREDHQA